MVESGGLARLRAGRAAALTRPRRLIHSRSLRVRAGLHKRKHRPNGRCFRVVESGGLEPSTFRV